MKAIIPVKLSERLPYKHLLKLGNKSIIETVYEKVSRVFDTTVYSRIDLPVPYIQDESENIMQLVFNLQKSVGTFALIGGDMPFFTSEDLELLRKSFVGHSVVPADEKGNPEPMFSIYSGKPALAPNLRQALIDENTTFISTALFSEFAFFNINTEEDYEQARKIWSKNNEF